MGNANMIRKVVQGGLMVSSMGMLMGNTSCQQDQTPTRTLKKLVDLGTIKSPSLVIPNVGAFDFKFVANQQIYDVLAASDSFTMRYLPALTSNQDVTNSLTSRDQTLVGKTLPSSSNGVSTWSKEASCMVNLPQAKLYGSINSFEVVGGGGMSFGFSPTGPISIALGSLDFAIDFAQMDLSMTAINPLNQSVLSSVDIDANQTKTKVGASINLGQFQLGPSFYYQTPLATVTKNALTKAVAGIQGGMANDEWSSRVLANMDTQVTIIGGENVNLKVGDQVAFYNTIYYWSGEPCAEGSVYQGGAAVSPVAIGVVQGVGDNVSIVKLTMQNDENVVIGAKVKLYQLAEAKTPNTAIDTSGLTKVGSGQ